MSISGSFTVDNATSVEREELLAELQLMRAMEPHENILNLLGQCTTGGRLPSSLSPCVIYNVCVYRWSSVSHCGVCHLWKSERFLTSV